MPPQVRESSEQLRNLPGVQGSFSADTTATAKAVSQIGRDLQNNPVLAAIGNAFEQKEKRNVEDAYMRLQSANNAHLNGGAYTLTDDPLDVDEGGGFLIKRGKNAEGSDEDYRATMQKVKDRLTSKMNASERQQFEKLYKHTTESSLASLRRNTEQEMFRYKSQMTDSTLQSAAATHLSTAINAYTQQQSFNNGAMDMAGRKAVATDDIQSIPNTQTAIAAQSQQQAVGAFTDWHNAITTEYEHAADFMRSQGTDETTIAWRKQEFFKSQGVAMTQALAAKAQTAERDSNAAEWFAMAAKAAEVTLPPALKADALSGLETIKNQRLQTLLGTARAERDLDKQDQLITLAENAARNFNANGKLLGAVAEEATAIRTNAQRKENEFAYVALATATPYDPKDNVRMQTALNWAKPRFEKQQRAALSRKLTEQGNFLAVMSANGVGFDKDGNLIAQSIDDRRSTLRTHLANGDMTGAKFMAISADLDKIEQSGKKPLYERVSADVCVALGKEIKTAWHDGAAVLDDKQDPTKSVGSYSFDETRVRLEPEIENLGEDVFPVGGGFTRVPRWRETGRMTTQTSVIKQQRDILAADIPKLIKLLMDAKSADGLMVDLDDNPRTPAAKFDYNAYYAVSLKDLKSKILAVDLDSQARGIFAAVSKKSNEDKAITGAAILRNAKLRLPSADEPAQTPEDSYDY